MSSLKPEDVLKAETVIEPLQKHSHELRVINYKKYYIIIIIITAIIY